jgi:heme-degrading monooxygenase HmoA
MVIERVEFPVAVGREADFEAAMQRGAALLAAAPGCVSVTLARGIERSSRYLLMLTWRSLDHHTAFTAADGFSRFRELAAPFFAERPAMEHFQPVFSTGDRC